MTGPDWLSPSEAARQRVQVLRSLTLGDFSGPDFWNVLEGSLAGDYHVQRAAGRSEGWTTDDVKGLVDMIMEHVDSPDNDSRFTRVADRLDLQVGLDKARQILGDPERKRLKVTVTIQEVFDWDPDESPETNATRAATDLIYWGTDDDFPDVGGLFTWPPERIKIQGEWLPEDPQEEPQEAAP